MRTIQLFGLRVPFLVLLLITFGAGDAALASKYKVLYGFSGGVDGGGLYSGVIIDASDNLYGGTVGGGDGGGGTIYQLQRQPDGSWVKIVIHDLDFHTEGGNPNNGMVFDPAGNLYGTMEDGGPQQFGGVFQLVPNPDGPWTLNLLYDIGSFTGLTLDAAGNLYGLGLGAFELSPTPDGWTYQQIYGFTGDNDAGGFYSPMILDRAGNLYGTAQYGGNHGPPCVGAAGCGVVFKLHPNGDGSWTGHILHKFAAWLYDGQYSIGGVVRDAAGNLYGTTEQGGSHRTKSGSCELGCGTIYKLSRKPDGHWKETILYNFPHFKDGLFPVAGPTLDGDGNLYGTASFGGDSNCGCGVVYKMTHNPDDTWTYSVLHRIHQGEGNGPVAPLVMDKKGNLYGTTVTGGPGGKGVVFKITP